MNTMIVCLLRSSWLWTQVCIIRGGMFPNILSEESKCVCSPLGMFTVSTWHSGCIGVTVTKQEKSSINTFLMRFKCSLAIMVCSTLGTWVSWAQCIARKVLSTTGPFHFAKYARQWTICMRKAVRPRPCESGLRNRNTWVWNAKVAFANLTFFTSGTTNRDVHLWWKLPHLMHGMSCKDTWPWAIQKLRDP